MPERRYDDAEIAEILALATRHDGAEGAEHGRWVRARLGSWTREREAQMEELAAWAPGLVRGDSPELAPPAEEG